MWKKAQNLQTVEVQKAKISNEVVDKQFIIDFKSFFCFFLAFIEKDLFNPVN